ncbi:SDR family NAD(P)-dependent oxidoreductase [bacterium]|nr:SDR family NAD(P)-dependent oxidoreductase [bacterium]
MQSSNNTVLITGGATGIGFALAKKFHDVGGNRVIIASRSESALVSVKNTLANVETVRCDITVAEDRRKLATDYAATNILINNAGIQVNGEFWKLDDGFIKNEIDVNFQAPVLLSKLFLPNLLNKKSAAIINVSSILGVVPKDSAPVYCATKAAIHSFSISLRWQLEKTSVKVFDILPPLVDTAMTSGRGKGKISPEQLVEEFWLAFLSDKQEVFIGKAKLLKILTRFLPALAEKIVRKN